MVRGFISLTLPIIDVGHIEVLNFCQDRCDQLIIGITTDEMCRRFDVDTVADFGKRVAIIESLCPSAKIFPQTTWSGIDVIKRERPELVFHSDDYTTIPVDGVEFELKEFLKQVGIKLHEFSRRKFREFRAQPRVGDSVSSLLKRGESVLAIDVYDEISGFAAADWMRSRNSRLNAVWGSSLTYSASRLREDSEFFSLQERVIDYARLFERFGFPIIVDGDTGGSIINLQKAIKIMDSSSIDCIVLEDKIGSKSNSLIKSVHRHTLSDISSYADKFKAIRDSTNNDDFVAIARLEGLICGSSHSEIVDRASAVMSAGASGVMIHTKDSHAEEVVSVIEKVKLENDEALLMMIPQNILSSTPEFWFDLGISILVYPNQMLRAAISSYYSLLESIDTGGSLGAITDGLVPISFLIDIESKISSLTNR